MRKVFLFNSMAILRCNSLRQWREELVPASGVQVEFEPRHNTPFGVSLNLFLDLPGIFEFELSSGLGTHTAEHAKASDGAFQFQFALSDKTDHQQLGRQLRLKTGEAMLIRGDAPYTKCAPGNFSGTVILVPAAEFEARGIRPDDTVMQRLSASQREALPLLRGYLRTLAGRDMAGASASLRQSIQRHIFDLLAFSVSWRGSMGESSQPSVMDARLGAALDYIAAHFSDPCLTMERVAASQGITPRYLHRLLAAAGHSYVELVNEHRLQSVFAALSSASPQKRTITDFALEAGFSDISHFNHLFRARFGDTPTGIRAHAAS